MWRLCLWLTQVTLNALDAIVQLFWAACFLPSLLEYISLSLRLFLFRFYLEKLWKGRLTIQLINLRIKLNQWVCSCSKMQQNAPELPLARKMSFFVSSRVKSPEHFPRKAELQFSIKRVPINVKNCQPPGNIDLYFCSNNNALASESDSEISMWFFLLSKGAKRSYVRSFEKWFALRFGCTFLYFSFYFLKDLRERDSWKAAVNIIHFWGIKNSSFFDKWGTFGCYVIHFLIPLMEIPINKIEPI